MALAWQVATVAALKDETPRVKTLTLDVPGWAGHKAGQHVDIRLTAADGYQAQRSYSIASAPGNHGQLELTIERVEGGEVSPFLHDELIVATASRCAARSVATSSGTPPRPGRCCWSPAALASCR